MAASRGAQVCMIQKLFYQPGLSQQTRLSNPRKTCISLVAGAFKWLCASFGSDPLLGVGMGDELRTVWHCLY